MPRYKLSLEGWLCGSRNLRAYFKTNIETLVKWSVIEDFPLSRLPNGAYVTSTSLADVWLMKRRVSLGERNALHPPKLAAKIQASMGEMTHGDAASESR